MLAISLAAALLGQEAAAPQSQSEDAQVTPSDTQRVSEVALDFLAQLPPSLEDWEPEGFETQAALQSFAMLGREDLVQQINPGAYQYRPCPVVEGEALETVIAAAREAQIVFINEAHDQPFHRHVIAQLGTAISDEFDIFAAETLNYLRLMGPRRPGALGWYDREPVFARQIATLEEAGYRLVAYEIRAHQRDRDAQGFTQRIAVREEAQANNLIAEVLEDDPEARILIHVGYSHLLEVPEPAGEEGGELQWFASRLKEKTGIDPLTISQTHCSPVAASRDTTEDTTDAAADASGGDAGEEGGEATEGEGSQADASSEAAPASAPQSLDLEPGEIVLVDGTGVAMEGAVDLFIARGPMSYTDHRPDWRRTIGDIDVAIPQALLPTDAPVIVEARRPDDTLDHTPADRLLVYPGEAPVLLLMPGEYVLTAWSVEGQLGEAVEVRVD